MQVQLEEMMTARKEGGGHQGYGTFRGAFETLEATVVPLKDILPDEAEILERLAADESELKQDEMLEKIKHIHTQVETLVKSFENLGAPRSRACTIS